MGGGNSWGKNGGGKMSGEILAGRFQPSAVCAAKTQTNVQISPPKGMKK